MRTVRVWFQKIGAARYISHLDLNRCMSRAIHRARIPLWYTEGFNPHAFITFALPLSLGMAGERESMDIKVDETKITDDELLRLLRGALPDDLPVLAATEPEMKPGLIAAASFRLLYGPESVDAPTFLQRYGELLAMPSVTVPKRTKSGVIQLDIKPYLGEITLLREGGKVLAQAVLPAGSTLNINPTLIGDALTRYFGLDFFCEMSRMGLYDAQMRPFA